VFKSKHGRNPEGVSSEKGNDVIVHVMIPVTGYGIASSGTPSDYAARQAELDILLHEIRKENESKTQPYIVGD
jgi:hypothetical protein